MAGYLQPCQSARRVLLGRLALHNPCRVVERRAIASEFTESWLSAVAFPINALRKEAEAKKDAVSPMKARPRMLCSPAMRSSQCLIRQEPVGTAETQRRSGCYGRVDSAASRCTRGLARPELASSSSVLPIHVTAWRLRRHRRFRLAPADVGIGIRTRRVLVEHRLLRWHSFDR